MYVRISQDNLHERQSKRRRKSEEQKRPGRNCSRINLIASCVRVRPKSIPTLIVFPSLMTVNTVSYLCTGRSCTSKTACRTSAKVIQSEESCFQWSRRQLITQFRGREPPWCNVYGRKGSPLGLEIIVITVIKIHGLFALEREGNGCFSSATLDRGMPRFIRSARGNTSVPEV